MLNQISAVISDADKTEIKTCLDTFESKMPFLRMATKKETGGNQNLGDNLDFVKKGINAIKLKPKIVAGTFEIEEYIKDAELFDQLYEIQQTLVTLNAKMKDTMILLGQDMIQNTNEVYNALKDGVKTDRSLQSLLDEMKPFYAKSKKESEKPTAPEK